MDFLETVLTGMKEQEVREFRYFLNRHPQGAGQDTGQARRDLALVDLIRKSGEAEREVDPAILIYGTRDRNAYHQLRNRLRKSLEDFLFFENSRKGSEFEIRKYIEIARYLLQRNAWEQAMASIEKAENLALADHNFSELSSLYNLMIRHSAHMPWVSLQEIMHKRKANQEKLDQQFHDLFIISQIREMLEAGDKLKSHIDIDYAVNRIMARHHIQDEDPEHAILWLNICSLVSEILLQRNLLDILEQYLILKHREFGEKPVYSSAGNGYRLRMLWQITSLLFRKNKLNILDKYLFELKYEAEKLRDIYPEMEDRLRCVEAMAGLKTGQTARTRQALDLISPQNSLLKPWQYWLEAELALATHQPGTILFSWVDKIQPDTLPVNSDHLLLCMAVRNLMIRSEMQTNTQWALPGILEHFKPLGTQPNSAGLYSRIQSQDSLPKNLLSELRLPEAGSIGFLTLAGTVA